MLRRSSRILLAIAVALAGSISGPGLLPGRAAGISISVSGNQLIDGAGQPIHVHGVNKAGSAYACIDGYGFFDGPADLASVQAMATWNVNMVRIDLNEDCWLGINGSPPAYSGANYRNAIVNYVNLLHQNGMYAEITLMWTAPGTQQPRSNPMMPDQDHAPAAWTSIATTFKNDPAVIFGTLNEPHGIGWTCWLNGGSSCNIGFTVAGFQELVTTIRQTGATQPITIGGINYANDMTGWLANKPMDPLNALVAETHVYGKNPCDNPTCFDAQMLPVAQTVPMLWAEVGETWDASDCGSTYVAVNIPWAEQHTVGFEAWTWDTWGNCSALIANYSGTPYTAYGQWVHDHMIATQTKTVPAAPTNVVAVGSSASATVSWTAPWNGWSPITSYTVTSTPAGGATSVSGSTTSARLTGLTNGTSYTFSVMATNAVGTGPASAPSNAVIPGVPVVVSSVNPTNGPAAGGTLVTITGSGFTGVTAVKFGGVAASSFTVTSDTQIMATSPAAAPGSVDVTVVVAGRSNPLGLVDRFSYGNLLDVVSTRQYQLSGSDGQTWTDLDGQALSLVIASTVNEKVVLSGNADLWTARVGVNQDLGIDVNGSLVAWKESGGFAGTFSPNAAYVQTVVTMNAGTSYVVKLRWKSNIATTGTIYAGAGPIGGQYSPTRLTAKLIPTTNATVSSAVSHAQDSLSGNDGSAWADLDGGAVSTNFTPAIAGMALLGGNADLWTGTTGINQDLGIWLSGGTYGNGQLVAWKESGGYAGTLSPNAAFVQTAQPVQAGVLYTVKLQWKANRPENGGTIYAGAGAGGPYSPTGVTVQLLPANTVSVWSSSIQYSLSGSLNDGMQWLPIDPGPALSLTAGSTCLALLSGNADLWTATAGYNQDLAISVNNTIIGWKESGGYAGTFSPNAAFVQAVLPMNAGSGYWMGIRWKANKPAQAATIYAGAGSAPNISPTSLIVELTC